MAKLSLLSISLSVLFLLNCSIAQQQQQQQQFECQIQRLNVQQPTGKLQAEGGDTEFWDSNNQQFRCAGTTVFRHRIQPRGLLLPSYDNAPLLAFIERGRGYFGVLLPGCPETFESSQQQSGEQKVQAFRDRHQKVRHFREGDFVTIPAGVPHWMYNNGEEDAIVVVMSDTSNNANQLDNNHRRFFIAGHAQTGQQQQHGQGQQGQQQQQQRNWGNILSGFDSQLLAQVLNVDEQTVKKIQGEGDQRGHIIRVQKELQVISPPLSREEQEREEEQQQREQQGHGSRNGLEETICSARLQENRNDPIQADFYNPQAGRLSTLNSLNLPILRFLRLSAERGFLHRNAIMAPHWNLNTHSIIYATDGDARVQIVDNRGQAVFDDHLRRGQIVVVPQNFAVVKQAGDQGFQWAAFKTNDIAMFNTLAGRTSALRGIPESVLANAFQISEQEAHRVKFNRMETVLFSPGPHQPRGEKFVNLVQDLIIGGV